MFRITSDEQFMAVCGMLNYSANSHITCTFLERTSDLHMAYTPESWVEHYLHRHHQIWQLHIRKSC